MAVATTIALIIDCPTNAQYLIIYFLIGLGAAFLLFRSAGKSTVKYKLWNIAVGLSGPIALPYILMMVNPIDYFRSDRCNLPVSITVFVHGKKGKQDMILRQQGHVVMDVNGERKSEAINDKGQAVFHNLHVDEKVYLDIDFSEPFRALFPDSQYVIARNGKIYLPVALQGIGQIQGTITYNEQPLAGVIVKINALMDTSNTTGYYQLSIPDSLQAKQYEVWFMKEGFKTKSVNAYPQTGQPLNIIMEK